SRRLSVVLGCVIGLTTALKYRVSILAEVLPTDPKTVKCASHWAGAHHVSFAKPGGVRYALDGETFAEMWKLSESEAEGCFMRIEHAEYSHAGGSISHATHLVPPSFSERNPYRFRSHGGRCLQHHYARSTVRASGCARYLGGVEDEKVYPIRGQTVLTMASSILEHAFPPRLRSAGADAAAAPCVEDVLPFVVEEGCELRPARKGGVRLEAGSIEVPRTDRTIPVVYNYG
ncbi:D-amino-acid oxidase, partial [Ephemerocybe angulata]